MGYKILRIDSYCFELIKRIKNDKINKQYECASILPFETRKSNIDEYITTYMCKRAFNLFTV